MKFKVAEVIIICFPLLTYVISVEWIKCRSVDKVPGECLPHATCRQVYDDLQKAPDMACKMMGGTPGICCPLTSGTDGLHGRNADQLLKTVLRRPFGSDANGSALVSPAGPSVGFWVDLISRELVQSARLDGLRKLLTRERVEEKLLEGGVTVDEGTPEYLHQLFLQPFPEALEQAKQAVIQVESNKAILGSIEAKQIINKFTLVSRQGGGGGGLGMDMTSTCRQNPCNPFLAASKYRSIDGNCNNIQHSDWGRSFTALDRLVRPQYDDGFATPRQKGSDGNLLPSAREISASTVSNVNRPSPVATLVLMNWGQFLNHDITLTAVSAMSNGQGIRCCSGLQGTLAFLRHEDCFPIAISPQDPFYGPRKQTCMEFVRSLPAASDRKTCEFGFRDQLNEVTAFIDGSVVYGSLDRVAKELRQFDKGKLKTTKCFGHEYLPFRKGSSERCSRPFQMFLTGDIRAPEQAHLSALHTIMVREHNRIAERLSDLNNHWNDEIIFQETRRIVGAVLQHVTYNEFLPLVLGSRILESVNLIPIKAGYSKDYNANVHPAILNEFAAAANRYGHSLIQGTMDMLNADDQTEGTLQMRHQFVTPVPLYFPQNLDRIIRGITLQPVQQVDPFMSFDVTQHLYEVGGDFGLDLAAANIQRGRDHGLGPYTVYRHFCGLGKATDFDDLLKQMNTDVVSKLKTIYKNVNDIDLWIGLISERSLKGALVGPTLACLLVEQYWRLKVSDRYWYEYGEGPAPFTIDQLIEIRKTTLARLLCNNGDNLHQMQPLAFLQPANWNPRVSCNSSSIPTMDLDPWKEVINSINSKDIQDQEDNR